MNGADPAHVWCPGKSVKLSNRRTRSGCKRPVRPLEGRRHFGHEAGHLVLHLRVRLQADVEVEDHLGETRGLDLLQRLGDAAAEPSSTSSRSGPRAHLVQAIDHLDEVAVARRRGLGVAREGRDHAFLVVADLARALRRLLAGVSAKWVK